MTTPPPLNLPELVGEPGWSRLPAAVQRRFAPGHGDAVYQGHMDLKCSRIGRWLALLARPLQSPLTDLRAVHLASTVRVSQEGAGVVWARCFGNGKAEVRSTKELGPDGLLQERTDGGLATRLAVFEQDGDLVFESRRYLFVWRGLRLPIPHCFSPGTCRVEHRDLGAGTFRFTLSMRHPLWGETFHQTGVFADPTP
ncbi:MAG: DUF4166 domain-containing protein [Inhella sp.]